MHFLRAKTAEDDHWISVSDMMAGLMMIFLFIAIIYIQDVSRYFDAVSNVTNEICSDLGREFEKETKKWDMTICENGLLITFENDSNFELDSSALSEEFKIILTDFFPRLMRVINKYSEKVSELRIEGHTDSSVPSDMNELSGYLYNTRLSQDRSRNVMDYGLNLVEIHTSNDYLTWALSNITANGMSSSKRVFNKDRTEDFAKSRRVEFRLRTKAEGKLLDLVKEISADGT